MHFNSELQTQRGLLKLRYFNFRPPIKQLSNHFSFYVFVKRKENKILTSKMNVTHKVNFTRMQRPSTKTGNDLAQVKMLKCEELVLHQNTCMYLHQQRHCCCSETSAGTCSQQLYKSERNKLKVFQKKSALDCVDVFLLYHFLCV